MRELGGPRLLALFGVLICWSAVSIAEAQPCPCDCPANVAPFFPDTVAVHPLVVAPNARILARLLGWDASSVMLTTSAGEPVAFNLEAAGDTAGTSFWLAPLAPFAPGDYSISANAPATGYTGHWAFTVDGAADTTPPSVSALTLDGALPDNAYCHDIVGGIVSWGGPLSARTDFVPEVELYRGAVMIARIFPPDLAFGTTDAPSCFGDGVVDGLVAGETLTAHVRIWDAAGNATSFQSFDFSPTLAHANHATCPAGCLSVGPAPRSTTFVCLGLAIPIFWWRRRHSRRRA